MDSTRPSGVRASCARSRLRSTPAAASWRRRRRVCAGSKGRAEKVVAATIGAEGPLGHEGGELLQVALQIVPGLRLSRLGLGDQAGKEVGMGARGVWGHQTLAARHKTPHAGLKAIAGLIDKVIRRVLGKHRQPPGYVHECCSSAPEGADRGSDRSVGAIICLDCTIEICRRIEALHTTSTEQSW